MEKMTNVKALEAVIAYAEANAEAFSTEVVEKITTIRDSYAKKGTNRKPTERQEENVQLRLDIKNFIYTEGRAVTASEVLEAVKGNYANLTLPRVTPQLTALTKSGEINRIVEKKKAYFTAVADVADVTEGE